MDVVKKVPRHREGAAIFLYPWPRTGIRPDEAHTLPGAKVYKELEDAPVLGYGNSSSSDHNRDKNIPRWHFSSMGKTEAFGLSLPHRAIPAGCASSETEGSVTVFLESIGRMTDWDLDAILTHQESLVLPMIKTAARHDTRAGNGAVPSSKVVSMMEVQQRPGIAAKPAGRPGVSGVFYLLGHWFLLKLGQGQLFALSHQ